MPTLAQWKLFFVQTYYILTRIPEIRISAYSWNPMDYWTWHWCSTFVNENYSRIEVENYGYYLIANPIYDFTYIYQGKTITVPIYSNKRNIKLASTDGYRNKLFIHNTPYTKMFIPKILEFIKINSCYELDMKNLDPKIKNLLLFV